MGPETNSESANPFMTPWIESPSEVEGAPQQAEDPDLGVSDDEKIAVTAHDRNARIANEFFHDNVKIPAGAVRIDRDAYARIMQHRGMTEFEAVKAADEFYKENGTWFVDSPSLGDIPGILGDIFGNLDSSWWKELKDTFDLENIPAAARLGWELITAPLHAGKLFIREEEMPYFSGLVSYVVNNHNIFTEAGRAEFAEFVRANPAEFIANVASFFPPIGAARVLKGGKIAKTAAKAADAALDPGSLPGAAVGAVKDFRYRGTQFDPDLQAAEGRLRTRDPKLEAPRSVAAADIIAQRKTADAVRSAATSRIASRIEKFYRRLTEIGDSLVRRPVERATFGEEFVTEFQNVKTKFGEAYDTAEDELFNSAPTNPLDHKITARGPKVAGFNVGAGGILTPTTRQQRFPSPFDPVVAEIDAILSTSHIASEIGFHGDLEALKKFRDGLMNLESFTIGQMRQARTDYRNAESIKFGNFSMKLPHNEKWSQDLYRALDQAYLNALNDAAPGLAKEARELSHIYYDRMQAVDNSVARRVERMINDKKSYVEVAKALLNDNLVTANAYDTIAGMFRPELPVFDQGAIRRERTSSPLPEDFRSFYLQELIEKAKVRVDGLEQPILTAKSLAAELDKRQRSSHEIILGKDNYDALEDLLVMLKKSEVLETSFSRRAPDYGLKNLFLIGVETAYATEIGRGLLGMDSNRLRPAMLAAGILSMVGAARYRQLRESRRPDLRLPEASSVRAMLKRAREIAGDPARRGVVNAENERELLDMLYPQ